MYSDEYKSIIYRLNEQFRKSSKRLERDFNIKSNIELKTPSEIRNERELNSYIKRVSTFNKKARSYRAYSSGYKITPTKVITPRGNVLTKAQVNKLRKEVNRINQAKRRRAIKYDLNRKIKQSGKETDMTIKDFAGLGKTKYDEFKPIKLNLNVISTKRDYNRILNRLEKQYTKEYYDKRNKQFIKNYKRSLINVFGNSESYKIRRQINKMSVDEFLKIYYSDIDISFSFMYSFYDSNAKLKVLEEIFM